MGLPLVGSAVALSLIWLVVAKSIVIGLSLLVRPLALKLIGRSICWCVGSSFGPSLGVNFSVPLLVGLFVGGSVVLDGWSVEQ